MALRNFSFVGRPKLDYQINLDASLERYLEGDAVQILPDSSDNLDIEILFNNRQSSANTIMIGFEDSTGDNLFFVIFSNTSCLIQMRRNAVDDFTEIGVVSIPTNGKFTIKGNVGSMDFAIDDVIFKNVVGTFDLTNFHSIKSTYGARFDSGPQEYISFSDISFDKIKVQNNIWNFTEGSGSDSLSNTGINMTLNTLSNLSVVSSNDYIELTMLAQTGNNFDVEQVDFTATTPTGISFLIVNAVDLIYSKDPTFTTFTRGVSRADISSGSVVIAHVLSSPINVAPGETFYLRWYPYDSASVNAEMQLHTVRPLVKGKENGGASITILEWETDILTSVINVNASIMVAQYNLGAGLLQIGNIGRWQSVPEPIFDHNSMWELTT